MSDDHQNSSGAPRKRGLTSLTLQWMADRFKRARQIEEAVKSGQYKVDSEKIANALVGVKDAE